MAGVPTTRIGTAGWAIPRTVADGFPQHGSGLERYGGVFNAAEINTTFYRPHKPETFQRWAGSVPDGFRFAVKAPRTVTHERRLVDVGPLLDAFFGQIRMLGDRLGPVLIQLPPTLTFDAAIADAFFQMAGGLADSALVVEPRHASWFEAEAEALLAGHGAARVAADPARVPLAARPGGWRGLTYHRLHGSPRMYYSAYDDSVLDALASEVRRVANETWCIFDNTASGAAADDALRLRTRLAR